VYVEGAAPGDTLRVDILELEPGDWGWCVILPGLGTLPDQFPEPYLRTFDLRSGTHADLVPACAPGGRRRRDVERRPDPPAFRVHRSGRLRAATGSSRTGGERLAQALSVGAV
jgi:hypothetical protein